MRDIIIKVLPVSTREDFSHLIGEYYIDTPDAVRSVCREAERQAVIHDERGVQFHLITVSCGDIEAVYCVAKSNNPYAPINTRVSSAINRGVNDIARRMLFSRD